MVGGGSKSEVRWKLICGDVEIVGESAGRSPYDESVTAPACTLCTVSMKDTYGDGWQGGRWTGFGQSFTGPTDAQNKAWVSETFTTSGCPAVEANTTDSNSTALNETSVSETVTSNVAMVDGGSKSEVRWKLTCGDDEIVGESEGRSPYN